MAKKKNNKLQKGVAHLVLMHFIRKKIVQIEREKAENRALKGKKQSMIAAKLPKPDLIFYQMAGGRPSRMKIKTKKNRDGELIVKKAALVRRRRSLGRIAAGLVLKELNKKAVRKKFGIL